MNVIFDAALKATLVLMQPLPAHLRFYPLNVVVSRVIIHCKAPARKAEKAPYKSSYYLHGGLHITRYHLLLGRQVTLRGKTGITTLELAGFDPMSPHPAAEHTNYSTKDEIFILNNYHAFLFSSKNSCMVSLIITAGMFRSQKNKIAVTKTKQKLP